MARETVIKSEGVFAANADGYRNVPAWQGLGTVLDVNGKKGIDVETALAKSGLDWEVKRVPIFAMHGKSRVKIDDRYGVQRETDGAILGVVGSTWRPVQNRAGFSTLQTLLEQAGGEVWIESAGMLNGGKKVWIMARCENSLQIAGESYLSHIGFVNGHDGRTSVTAFLSDMRTACTNFLNFVWHGKRTGYGHGARIVRVRHTVKAEQRITEAHELLGLRNLELEEMARQAEWMVEDPMSDGAFEMFMEALMPLPEESEHPVTGNLTPAATMITQRREEIGDIYLNAENLNRIRGTKWGALNAVIEYADHGRVTKNASALCASQFGLGPVTLKQKAYALLAPKGQ